jgi:hypothetical protein
MFSRRKIVLFIGTYFRAYESLRGRRLGRVRIQAWTGGKQVIYPASVPPR